MEYNSPSVTTDSFHLLRSWLKDVAWKIMYAIFSTVDTFHDPMSRLKHVAKENIFVMSITLDTSQVPISWLNDDAKENIFVMFVTLDTSQHSIFWLEGMCFMKLVAHTCLPTWKHPEIVEVSCKRKQYLIHVDHI
jgi:hypothetical protein